MQHRLDAAARAVVGAAARAGRARRVARLACPLGRKVLGVAAEAHARAVVHGAAVRTRRAVTRERPVAFGAVIVALPAGRLAVRILARRACRHARAAGERHVIEEGERPRASGARRGRRAVALLAHLVARLARAEAVLLHRKGAIGRASGFALAAVQEGHRAVWAAAEALRGPRAAAGATRGRARRTDVGLSAVVPPSAEWRAIGDALASASGPVEAERRGHRARRALCRGEAPTGRTGDVTRGAHVDRRLVPAGARIPRLDLAVDAAPVVVDAIAVVTALRPSSPPVAADGRARVAAPHTAIGARPPRLDGALRAAAVARGRASVVALLVADA